MSESMWTDERIDKVALDALSYNGVMTFFRAKQLMGQVRDTYEHEIKHYQHLLSSSAALDAANQRIAELEAQAAWEPLPDGVYDTQHRGNKVKVSGEWLTVREKNAFDPNDAYVADAALPDNIRLCRRKEAQP